MRKWIRSLTYTSEELQKANRLANKREDLRWKMYFWKEQHPGEKIPNDLMSSWMSVVYETMELPEELHHFKEPITYGLF